MSNRRVALSVCIGIVCWFIAKYCYMNSWDLYLAFVSSAMVAGCTEIMFQLNVLLLTTPVEQLVKLTCSSDVESKCFIAMVDLLVVSVATCVVAFLYGCPRLPGGFLGR